MVYGKINQSRLHFFIPDEIFIARNLHSSQNQIFRSCSCTISVLYVDDEPSLLEITKLFLEQNGEFAVSTAESAASGLKLLESNTIQAIVSDYQMPGMDGIGFLKKVRSSNKKIPFIMFTGKGREEIAVEAFENGADFYLQKGGAPKSQFAELTHKIRAAVEHRQADAQVSILNRLYSVLSATNKAIVRIHDKRELLDEICRIVVDTGGFTMAWAGLVNDANHLIEPAGAAGHVEGYFETNSISTDDIPRGRGPTGTAFREKKFIICNDIEKDPIMEPWRKGALQRGYRSIAAFPFGLGTKNAGVITYYASEPDFFSDQIIRLLNEQSMDISFAFETFEHEDQRRAAEDELKRSELQYRRLFQTAQDAILILDGDTGEIIDANQFILDMLGYPLDYFVGKHLWELGFLKDKNLAKEAFTKLKTEGYIRYEDLPLETQQGKSMSVEFVSNVYLVGTKRIIQCNIRDITERKTLQDILKASEARYRRLFETAQDGILILDGDTGEIIDANAFIINLLGYPLDYFVGKHLWELGFLKDKNLAKEAFTKLKTEGYIRYEDLPLETQQGKAIHVEFVSNAYLVGTRRIIQCNIRDFTDRKRAEDALTLASRKLNLMSGITRHDIMNQLTVLLGYLDFARAVVKEPEGISHIAKVKKAADTIQRQIEFTREYEDLGVKAPQWQRVSDIIRSAASQLADTTITFEIPDEPLEVYADPLFIKVFYNLFDNSKQHGGTVSRISISYRVAGTGLIVVVADNGTGISVSDKQHLFERGFGKHTGLGLFLSREILSITGISITETGTPGTGVRFEIAVPEGSFRFTEEPVLLK